MKPANQRMAWIALSIGIAAVSLLRFLPSTLDTTALKAEIEQGLLESTGVQFHIRALSIEPTLFHGIQAHLHQAQLTDGQRHPLGQIRTITVQIRYLPLLFRQTPEIALIELKDTHIPVGSYNLFQVLRLNPVPPKKTGFLNPPELRDTEFRLIDYRIEDHQPSAKSPSGLPEVQQLSVYGKSLSLRHLESTQPLSLRTTGRIVYQTPSPNQRSWRQSVLPYQLLTEVSPAVTQPKHPLAATDLKQLDLSLAAGSPLPLHLKLVQSDRQIIRLEVDSAKLNMGLIQSLAYRASQTLELPWSPPPYRLGGLAKARFKSSFQLAAGQLSAGQFPQLLSADGGIWLKNLTLSQAQQNTTPALRIPEAHIRLEHQRLTLPTSTVQLHNQALQISAWYLPHTQQLEAVLHGKGLNLASLGQKNAFWHQALGPTLNGRTINGFMDLNAHLQGTLRKPRYKALLVLRQGTLIDPSQGLRIQGAQGQLALSGQGFQKPQLAYQGRLIIPQGQLEQPEVSIQQLQGDIRFRGQWQPVAGRPAQSGLPAPQLEGDIRFAQGQYHSKQAPVPITGLQGNLQLLGQWIEIQNLQGKLGNALLKATGKLRTDLTQYQVLLSGNDIDLPQFHREVLAKIPQLQPALPSLKPLSGQANLRLNLQTGLKLSGELTLQALALQTAQTHSPLKVPYLALRLRDNTLSAPETNIYYGPVTLQLSGNANSQGAYHLRLKTNPIPLDFVRDQQTWLASLSGLQLPEIWNTAGSIRVQGTLSNQQQDISTEFQQAGLSWAGGDFPLYDLNGNLRFQQSGSNAPRLESRNLRFKYGNSPMRLTLTQNPLLQAELQGLLSELTVNHFLVSPQSNASPYQAMPLQITLSGLLASLPGQPGSNKNDLTGTVFVGLSQNFRQAYPNASASPSRAATPPASQSTLPEASETQAAPNIVGESIDRADLRNLNPINAANTALSAATNTVGRVRQTMEKGLELGLSPFKKPGQFISQKRMEKPHESVPTQAANPQTLPPHLQPEPLSPESGPDSRAFLSGRLRLLGNQLQLQRGTLHLFQGGEIVAEGIWQQLDHPQNSPYRLHLLTVPEINLAGIDQGATENSFFQGAKGTLGADLTLQSGGEDGSRQLTGWLASNRLEIPYLTLQDITARLEFTGENAQIDIPSFKVPGVTVRMSARSENIFEVPVPLEDVRVNGSFVSIESLGEFNNTVVKPILIDQVAHNYLRPWQQGDPTSAVQFRDGSLQVDEVIYQNVILNNLRSKLSLNGNSFLEMTDARLEAAGGQVSGYLSLSPNENSFTTLELNANGVKANALTKALLDVTNQIFGDLNGTVRFTTFGQSDLDMQKNANGTVSLKVTNGRLPAIAKVETLLATANVFRGGVLGLNLNNLFRSLTFNDTNYFAELSGDMLINNQVLYTQNLVSDGVNLDLLIQGSVRMDNGNANMLINGRMSQNVAGKLGAFGNWSLGRLLSYVPALGNLGEHRPGLLGYIPGVGYVPGFGGPAKQFNRFQVRLVGQPDDPNAIRDFRWIRPQNL